MLGGAGGGGGGGGGGEVIDKSSSRECKFFSAVDYTCWVINFMYEAF